MALPSSCDWTYDVFLSFRGTDTRNTFTGNLYNSLHQRGINTFFDEEKIHKGDEITPTLLQAIEHSRIFIAIFSKDYASSTFCLTELVTILECAKSHERLFFPIFYDVDPSQVRHLTGTYGEAFEKHEKRFRNEKDKVQKWRDALRQAANVSGCHFIPGSESEYKFIGKIVDEISIKINRVHLHVASKPVGLESQMLKVTSLIESNERVSMVGIYGLFSWPAVKNKKMDPSYVAKRAVSYCQGIPLALKVIGSQLFAKSLAVWKSSLDKYQRVIHKVSYDDLEEDVKGMLKDVKGVLKDFDREVEEDIEDMLKNVKGMLKDFDSEVEEDIEGMLKNVNGVLKYFDRELSDLWSA